MNTDSRQKRNIIIVTLIIIIVLLLYFLIRRFGFIDNIGLMVPTGNVDIFEIDCDCIDGQKNIDPIDDDVNKNINNDGGISVFDNYKVWDNKELRIFSNPAYEYESKIAPGSANSYTFVIRNNNDYDVVVDISFIEKNEKNINMNYKLRSKGKYLLGNDGDYALITGFKLENVSIPAKSQVPYFLDWKWVDGSNDTEIGFDNTASYGLSIQIGVK